MPYPALVVLAAGLAAVLGFVLLSRFVPERWLAADSDAASALYATIGMVYAILVALSAIAVWEPRSAASANAEREAAGLVEAHWAARDLDEPDRQAVQGLLVQYTTEVIEGEFPSLKLQRAPSARAEELLTYLRYRTEALGNEELTARVDELADARRSRIAVAGEGMPYPLWPILIGGGIVSTAFLYLFGLSRTFPNGLMMFLVGGMIALMLVVLHELEYPFGGSLGIGPGHFRMALDRLYNAPAA